MPRKPRPGPPTGGVIAVGPEERAELKLQREKLGLKQRELASKVGVSQATISNLENGRYPQIGRVAYANLRRVLAMPPNLDRKHEEAWRAFVLDVADLDPDFIEALRGVAAKMKR